MFGRGCQGLNSHIVKFCSGNLSKQKVECHIERLRSLKWNQFQAHPQLKTSASALKDDLVTLCDILCDKRDKLEINLKAKMPAASLNAPKKNKKVPVAFSTRNTVQLSEDSFYTEVDNVLMKKKKTKTLSPFTQCVKESVSGLMNKLRRTRDYEPIFVTDEDMKIDEYAEVVCNKPFLTPLDRARFRKLFRDELAKGEGGICFAVWGQMMGGSDPDNLFVWKIPTVQQRDHAGRFSFHFSTFRSSY